MDQKKEENLKKLLLWTLVAAGCVVVGLLMYYAPSDQDRMSKALSEVPSDHPTVTPEKPPISVEELAGLEFFPGEGQTHVEEGTRVTYKTDPPTSGFHYARWLPPGVYEIDKAKPEVLVHNLEHGNIVIYFDRGQLSKVDLDQLLEMPKKYAGQWDGVILVAQKGLKTPIILTAWRAKLPLGQYDTKKVNQFLDAFRGRGPENPIR